MKRIAVISDVHGNVPALEAVLVDLDSQEVDEVLVGGDLVGRGPEGSAVVRRIRERAWRGVRGNHEDYLLAFRGDEVPAEWADLEEWAAARFMADELDDTAARYIEQLPLTVRSKAIPDALLVHGTPRSNNEGLGPWTSDAELVEHLRSVEQTVLLCAHTHRPMCRRVPGGLVVNVGAVGLPFNGDRRAQYAILEGDGGEWKVVFRQVGYPVERTLEVYESSGFLEKGKVTARLLALELTHARPFLVPFVRWAVSRGVPVASSNLPRFLESYSP